MRKYEHGQALVLVLLSLSVVLTIVLFILSRSITDVSTSTQQADSVRAFSAAEAGIEQALITGIGASNTIGGAQYSVNVSDYSKGTKTYNYPLPLLSGESMTLWLVSHDAEGKLICSGSTYPCFTGDTMKVCWGNPGTAATNSDTPAMEVSLYYKANPASTDFSTVQVGRGTYDPNGSRSNNFGSVDGGACTIDGVNYAFQRTITFSSNLLVPVGSSSVAGGLIFAKIRLIYNTAGGHPVGVSVDYAGNSALPSQGHQIISTGTAGATGEQSNRRVSVFQGWPEYLFSGLAIFTPYGITK